jgi:uncharacterized membrane protein
MDQRTISWVSYLTLIGWIIALVNYNNSPTKSTLARLHLRQSLGLMLTWLAIYILAIFAVIALGFFGFITSILYLGVFVLWVLGLIAATNGEEKPVPLVGEFYQRSLTFIN